MKDYVQIGPTGLAIRIFRSKRAAVAFQVRAGHSVEPIIAQMEHKQAVDQIRRQVFARDEYTCVHCGKVLIWESGHENSAEMHEKQARGSCEQIGKYAYQSGEQSVDNCETLCKACHTGKGGKQDRSPSFSSNPTQTAGAQASLVERSLILLEGPCEKM